MNKDWMEYTAADLEKMSEKELVDLLENMPKFERTSDELLATMDVGKYDEAGNLIGIKETCTLTTEPFFKIPEFTLVRVVRNRHLLLQTGLGFRCSMFLSS